MWFIYNVVVGDVYAVVSEVGAGYIRKENVRFPFIEEKHLFEKEFSDWSIDG